MLANVEARARGTTLAIEQLQQLELDVTQCLKLAQEEIDARSSKLTNTVMYIPSPKYLCHYGNSDSGCRSIFYSLVCL